jgi:hypothetical protein
LHITVVYWVCFLIPASEGKFPPINLEAGGWTPNARDADAIIGNDILKKFMFTYHGPAREFLFSVENRAVLPFGQNQGPQDDVLFHLDE